MISREHLTLNMAKDKTRYFNNPEIRLFVHLGRRVSGKQLDALENDHIFFTFKIKLTSKLTLQRR